MWACRKAEDIYDSEVIGKRAKKNQFLTRVVSVLKLTQVGEMSILRRSRELALRNSAKYTRNFGRSVPTRV